MKAVERRIERLEANIPRLPCKKPGHDKFFFFATFDGSTSAEDDAVLQSIRECESCKDKTILVFQNWTERRDLIRLSGDQEAVQIAREVAELRLAGTWDEQSAKAQDLNERLEERRKAAAEIPEPLNFNFGSIGESEPAKPEQAPRVVFQDWSRPALPIAEEPDIPRAFSYEDIGD